VAVAPHSRAQALHLGAQAIGVATRVSRTPYGGGRTEARIVQPVAAARAAWGPLRLHAMLNLESVTMPDGELAPGVWGEGFTDRRHPHTTVHEAMLALVVGPASIAAGKGFVPYGTDDPMGRPALRFPVNHHWSQVLERAVVVGAVRLGPAALEAARFNGDEPESPGRWPKWDRFGDSWSARVTVFPWAGLELQASTAVVQSPEHRPGAGPAHRKRSLSARLERRLGYTWLYGLVEWARDEESNGIFRYHSALAEAEIRRGAARAWLRLERTERPEEERVFGDPFRSRRPHLDDTILGVTEWRTLTVGAGRRGRGPLGAGIEPIAEATLARVRNVLGVVMRPESVYGRPTQWAVTLGVRVTAGAPAHRMGRYGVLSEPEHRRAHP
jgi:hypothetical protein